MPRSRRTITDAQWEAIVGTDDTEDEPTEDELQEVIRQAHHDSWVRTHRSLHLWIAEISYADWVDAGGTSSSWRMIAGYASRVRQGGALTSRQTSWAQRHMDEYHLLIDEDEDDEDDEEDGIFPETVREPQRAVPKLSEVSGKYPQ